MKNKIEANKEKIIDMYKENIFVANIALKYGVALGTIYRY